MKYGRQRQKTKRQTKPGKR